MFNEKRKIKTSILVDEDLWKKVKAKAALEGEKVGEIIQELLKAYVEGKVKIKKEVVVNA